MSSHCKDNMFTWRGSEQLCRHSSLVPEAESEPVIFQVLVALLLGCGVLVIQTCKQPHSHMYTISESHFQNKLKKTPFCLLEGFLANLPIDVINNK